MTPLAIGQERSIKLVEDVVSGDRLLALVTVKNPEADQPGWDDLYEVGTAAVIHKMIKVPDGTLRILVQGLKRIKLDRQVQTIRISSASSSSCRTSCPRPRGRGADAQRPEPLRAASSASFPTCPKSCRSQRRTSTIRARSAISSPRRCA